MDFKELILKRRSTRKYAEGKSISKEEIREIAEAALMAASWKNSETARVYVGTPQGKYDAIMNSLPSYNQNSSKNAVAMVVTTFKKGISGFAGDEPANSLGDMWGAYDLGLHDAYFILKAKDMGYDSLIMGLRDEDALRKALDIPSDEEIVSVISLGVAEKEPNLNPRKNIDDALKID
ncbi:MAG: nitroreductase family protein [Lachnospiraceae bacterium]|nr:nitroreductase family protein [Lachnospiraceae bacterium]